MTSHHLPASAPTPHLQINIFLIWIKCPAETANPQVKPESTVTLHWTQMVESRCIRCVKWNVLHQFDPCFDFWEMFHAKSHYGKWTWHILGKLIPVEWRARFSNPCLNHFNDSFIINYIYYSCSFYDLILIKKLRGIFVVLKINLSCHGSVWRNWWGVKVIKNDEKTQCWSAHKNTLPKKWIWS